MFNKYEDIQVYVDFDIICFSSLSWLFVLFFVFMAWSEGLFYLEIMIVLGTFYLYFLGKFGIVGVLNCKNVW